MKKTLVERRDGWRTEMKRIYAMLGFSDRDADEFIETMEDGLLAVVEQEVIQSSRRGKIDQWD